MKTTRRWRWVAVGLPIVVVGLACLNYTSHHGWDHHTAMALEHGIPPPSERILRLGMVLTAAGGVLTGYGFARRPAERIPAA